MLQNFFSPVTDLPTPKNVSWFWLGGSLLGFTLVFQLISGYLLSIYYTSNSDFAFYCVDSMSRDIKYGEIVRHFHIFGASFFFLVIYFHIGRGLYYLSFKKKIMAWKTGVVLYMLLMATSFVGYVLPWAQMSFWAATVMTNFMTVMPFVGQSLVIWVWGSFSVDYTTLMRFYTLHFLLPSMMALFSCMHMWFLHYTGSSNPLGVGSDGSLQRFSTFSGVKDLLGLFVIFLSFLSLYLINPMIVKDSEQMIEANPFVTPVHIVPEWYFLPAYAMLRSVPKKLGGVICLVLFILVLFVYPFLISSFFKTNKISVFSMFFFWLWVFKFIFLIFLGGSLAEEPYISLSQFCSIFYFFYFFFNPLVFYLYFSFFNF